MKWIGVTGSMGSGKSSVCEIIKTAGFPVLDADHYARLALGPDSSLMPQLKSRFGVSVFDSSGVLDRKALGRRVFNSEEDLKWLEGLIHPVVQSQVAQERERLKRAGHKVAFYDVPLLFEKNLQKNFDEILVVSAPLAQMRQRIAERDKLSEEDILSRLKNQLPMDQKVAEAHHVIYNDGDLSELKSKVIRFLSPYKS